MVGFEALYAPPFDTELTSSRMKLRVASPARAKWEYSQRSRRSVQLAGKVSLPCPLPDECEQARTRVFQALARQPLLVHGMRDEPVHRVHDDEREQCNERKPEVGAVVGN